MVTEFDLGLLEARHATGDWGDTHLEDARANDDAVRDGDHILSSYPLACGDERCRYIDTRSPGGRNRLHPRAPRPVTQVSVTPLRQRTDRKRVSTPRPRHRY
jgi:hypothetical protein